MNRLQNLVLIIWGILLLLFVAFNWQMIWKPVEFVYLFMDLKLRVLLWLVVAGFGVALALRLMAMGSLRAGRRRAEKEISLIKARAFDGVTGEFERLVNDVKAHVDERIRSIRTAEAVEAPPASEPAPAETASAGDAPEKKTSGWRALTGAASADEAPKEDTAEEEEAGAADPEEEEEEEPPAEEKKPARRSRSKA